MRCTLLTILAGCAFTGMASSEPVPVEVWKGGDDGLTTRFRDAIESAISKSADFSLARAGEGSLIMTIPTHVYWKEVGTRINFSVVVILTNASSRYLGVSTGQCWEEEMSACAEKVLKDSRAVWVARPSASR